MAQDFPHAMIPAIPYPEPGCVFAAVDLKKSFDDGQVQALRGVDFRIEQGEFVAITGPSGCGKTTLLQILGALDRPSSGTLHYRGSPLGTLRDPAEYLAREIGFIFQAFHLLPTFTALENVQFPMFETDRRASERTDRAVELIKAVGLEHRLHHFPAKLSGGERQRIAIARSLANGPSVLLADEPTGNLDEKTADTVLAEFLRLVRDEGSAALIATHNERLAARMDRVVRLHEGVLG